MNQTNNLKERHENAKNEVAQIVTSLALNNLNVDNEFDLMVVANKVINNWCLVIKKIFAMEKLNEEDNYELLSLTTLNELEYAKHVMDVFDHDYHQLIIEVKILLSYMYLDNRDNVVAKVLSYAFEKENPRINNIESEFDNFYEELSNMYKGENYGKGNR